MDPGERQRLMQELDEADRQIADGIRHVEKQKRAVDTLERDAHDATQARALLATFQETLELHERHREQIRRALAL